jgi:phenylacetate-CoA ligase
VNRLSHSLYSAIYPALPVFAQNAACTIGGFWRAQTRFNPHFHATLARLERSAAASTEELVAIQRDRLDRLVRRAREHVPYYRDLPPPAEHRDPAEAIRRTLAAIPPLEKRTYRDQPRAFLARDVPRHRLRRGRTSGTTGTALPLWYTPETLGEEYATVWRLRRRCGIDVDAPHLSFTGQTIVPVGQFAPPFWRQNAWSGQTLFSIYHMTPDNLRTYVDAVHRARARYVQGYPSSIHLVARALLEAGRPVPPGHLAGVFTSSESLLAFQRETIEKAFGAPVRDRYGVSEFDVSMTECDAGRLHVDMEFCIVEVEVEEETAEYARGPLLITGLAGEATPRFRYRIGDVGTRARHPCPCGHPGDVFFEVDGRVEDYVLTPDGRLVGRMDHVFKEQFDVAEAQILQSDARSIDVMIVPRASWTDASERSVMKEIRSRLGDEIDVRIELVGQIAREPNGKFRAVKSAVGRNAG